MEPLPLTPASATSRGLPLNRPGPSGSTAEAADGERALEAARAFEKLLIHDMLKTMRRTAASIGEAPSNARSMYDDMLDERLATVMSEAGGLGLAETLAADLGGQSRGGSDAASVRDAAAGRGVPGLPAADLLRLRALARPRGADAVAGGDGGGAPTLAPGAGAIRPSNTRPVRPVDGSVDTEGQRAFLAPLIPHAHASARRLGTSADAVLAIAALESGWGRAVARDEDGRSSHNLFGIKARPDEPGAVTHLTAEYVDGERHEVLARFRAFSDRASAIDGFASFVLDNPRYAQALEHAADPPEFLRRLHAAGYATDPRYADKAIEVMRRVRALRESST